MLVKTCLYLNVFLLSAEVLAIVIEYYKRSV
jgi:hypothetical protein